MSRPDYELDFSRSELLMSCREYVLSTAVAVRVHIGRVSADDRTAVGIHFAPAGVRHNSLVLERAPRPHRREAIGMSLVQSLPRRLSRRMQCNFKLQSLSRRIAQSVVVGTDRLNVDIIKSYE